MPDNYKICNLLIKTLLTHQNITCLWIIRNENSVFHVIIRRIITITSHKYSLRGDFLINKRLITTFLPGFAFKRSNMSFWSFPGLFQVFIIINTLYYQGTISGNYFRALFKFRALFEYLVRKPS